MPKHHKLKLQQFKKNKNMKTLKKLLGLTAIVTVLFAFNSQAQTTTENLEKKHPKGQKKGIANLTDAQKAQFKANQEEAKKAQEIFRATLSDEQKAIIDNKDLKPEERRAALAKALSAEQKEMMKNNALERKQAAEKFSKTLTEVQKADMKQLAVKRKQRSGDRLKGKE